MHNLRPGSIFINYRRDDCLDEARTIRAVIAGRFAGIPSELLAGKSYDFYSMHSGRKQFNPRPSALICGQLKHHL